MPVWALTVIVTILQKTGLVNWAEALLAKGIIATEKKLETLQTFHEDQDFPSQDSKGQK